MNKSNTKIKTNKRNLSDKILEIPAIDMVSNREISIWGTKGVIEYTEELIRLNCGDIIVLIKGINLSMKALSVEDVIINGIISSLEFTSC